MSDFEFRLLRFIQRQPEPVRWVDVVNAFAPFTEPTETDSVLRALLAAGSIRAASPADPQLSRITLTDSGLLSVIEAHEQRCHIIAEKQQNQNEISRNIAREESRRNAERKADQKFQKRLSARNLILSALLSALLTNLDRIVPFVLSLFHS